MSSLLPVGWLALLALGLELIVLFFVLPLLKSAGVVRPNYRGVYIPVAVGITFPMALLLTYTTMRFTGRYGGEQFTVYLVGVISMCLLGLIDDLLGSRDTLGFRGHFRSLLQGELTTGGLKAVGGGIVALFSASFISLSWLDIIINTVLIALFTNFINLLDLRPGRAIKGFLFFLLLMLLPGRVNVLMFAPLVAAVLAYFPFDIKARTMMGDAGSNVLGFTLGVMSANGLDFPYKLGVLVFLVLIHLLAEKYSITELINNSTVLRYLDNLGRGGGNNDR